VIELVLRHADVAQVRFAHSPVHELVASAMTVRDPGRQTMHRRWLHWARSRLHGHCFELLFALTPPNQYIPDFLTPVHNSGPGDLDEEFEKIASTGVDEVRAQLDEMVRGGPSGRLPAAAQVLYDDPAGQLGRLVDELRGYWRLVVEPVWGRVFALTADDVGYRLQQCADEGIGRVLNSVSGQISYADNVITVDKRFNCRHDLGGGGLVLMPCVFVWPGVMVSCCGTAQPSLSYPPRGLGSAWEERSDPLPDALGALVGRTRAAMLDVLVLPVTTTQLAARLDISAAAASQHLQVLKAAALVASRRQGRQVLYQRTSAGTVLHNAARRKHFDGLPAELARRVS
jgi:DNA-binding transcriptional ArsR family regulator